MEHVAHDVVFEQPVRRLGQNRSAKAVVEDVVPNDPAGSHKIQIFLPAIGCKMGSFVTQRHVYRSRRRSWRRSVAVA